MMTNVVRVAPRPPGDRTTVLRITGSKTPVDELPETRAMKCYPPMERLKELARATDKLLQFDPNDPVLVAHSNLLGAQITAQSANHHVADRREELQRAKLGESER